MLEDIIEKENREFFFPRSMRLELLKKCTEVIPTLVHWAYEEWKQYDKSLTKEKLIDSFSRRLNSDTIPITFVVLKNEKAIATISIKKETSPEFSDFSTNSIWIGSFYVLPSERSKGLGSYLLKFTKTVTKKLGHNSLFLYTSNPTNVPWYIQQGAKVIEERPFRNHTITIMQIP